MGAYVIGKYGEPRGTQFAWQRIISAITAVAKAAGIDPDTVLPKPVSISLGDKNIEYIDFPIRFAERLGQLVQDVMNSRGSLTVRFLGDLKPSEYPMKTHFFQLGAGTENTREFSEMLKKAFMGEGGEEDMTFVNLATVRDVKIKVGNQEVALLGAEISYLSSFHETLVTWLGTDDPSTIPVYIFEIK